MFSYSTILIILNTCNKIAYKYIFLNGNYPDVTMSYQNRAKGKGKAAPLQAWTGPEGSRRLRHPDFKTIGT